MGNYLAKDDGTLLIDHLNNTVEIAEIYINEVYPDIPEQLQKISLLSCKLHDILKIQKTFQQYITGDIKYESQKFYHNEIAWAFLKRYINKEYIENYLNIDEFDELCLDDYINLLTDSIYFHHGNNYDINKPNINDILNELNDSDLQNVIDFINENISSDLVLDKNSKKINKNKIIVPLLYDSSEYSEDSYLISYLLLIKNILIFSDRISSEYPNKNKEFYIDYINSITNKKRNYKFDENILNKKGFNINLFNKHIQISEDLDKFTSVKAPAGFGKTMIGLISGFKSTKKILWVCTKKSITKGVYNEILKISELFNLDLDVQCVYTSEVQEYTKSEKLFESDIIVVNIDTFLSTTFKINEYKLEGIVSSGFVIFDEFHEVRMNNAIFPISVILMNHRSLFTKEKTLLLSATPFIGLNDFICSDIKILPNKKEHYPAKHNKKYYFKFINNIRDIDIEKSCIIFTGTVLNTQNEWIKYTNGEKEIIHGDFLNNIKEKKINNLIENFGNYSKEKQNIKLFTTNILQSAVNISFDNMCEYITSPESTIQEIGRCNRNGENESAIIYIINNLNDKSHYAYVNLLYDLNICKLWYKYLIDNFNNENGYTLDEIYIKYNEFNKLYENELRNVDRKLFTDNLEYIENINIKRISNKKTENKKIYANSNKLRHTFNECFYIVMYDNTDKIKFTEECFTKKLENNDIFATFVSGIDDYNTHKSGKLYKYMEYLTNNTDYDYSEVLKLYKRKNFYRTDLNKYLGKTNKTPVIIYNRDYYQYSNLLGLIKHK